MSTFGGYSFPVLHGMGLAGFGAPASDVITVARAAPDPPVYPDLPSLVAGQAYAILQMPAGSSARPTPASPADALTQINSWMEMWTRGRITAWVNKLDLPPALFADALMRSEGSLAGAQDAARRFEAGSRIPMGPQPGLDAWLDALNEILMRTGAEVQISAVGPKVLTVPYAVLADWLANAPKVIGPDALADPTFLGTVQDLHQVAWIARQVKQLEDLPLRRRLLQTRAGHDFAWFFADESAATAGKLNAWAPGWRPGITAILEPPRDLVDALIPKILAGSVGLQDRLAAGYKAHGITPPVLPRVAAFTGRALLAAGLALGVWWLWARHRPGRRAASSSAWSGPDLFRDVTPSARVVSSESFLPAVTFE